MVTSEKLKRIERGETLVRQLFGVRQVRVRDFDNYCKIEVNMEEISLLKDEKKFLILKKCLKELGLETVLIDLDGYRSGKLNVITD